MPPAPLRAGELAREVGVLRPSTTADLRDLHTLLVRATPLADDLPLAVLTQIADLVRPLPKQVVVGLGPRQRVVFRLLIAGAIESAWAVLIDNAAGQLPLRTRIKESRVFVELAGFRDPRFSAPDECYDVTDDIKLRHRLDEIRIEATVATFGGWASLDPLMTEPAEQVRLIASAGEREVTTTGRRHRRADLVAAKGEAAERRVWAGWSAPLDLADPSLVDGAWSLSLEVDHDGVRRRAPLSADAGELARAAANAVVQVGPRTIQWVVDERGWRLYVG